MKDAFVVWKNSRSIFGLTNYFAGQPRVAGAILSILFGLFLSACGGGSGSSPTVTPPPPPPPPLVVIDPITSTPDVIPPPPDVNPDPLTFPIIVDAPVQGLHYRSVGPVTLISRSQETDGRGGFNPGNYGTVAFAVGEITVVGEVSVSSDGMTTVVDNGDGLTLSQYKSNGFLGFIVHPAEDWINTESPVVFTPYDLRDAADNTVNVGAVARVLQGFDQTPPSTSPVGFNVDDNLILIHLGATAGRTVTIDRSSPAGQFSVQELDETGTVSTSIVGIEDNYTVVISPTQQYGGATLRFPLHSNAMETLSMVIADMADEIARFSDNSTITLKNGEARTGYFARRGAYSLVLTNLASIDPNTGSLNQYTVTSGNPPEVTVKFEYAGIARNQVIELDSLPKLKTEPEEDKTSQPFQIYFTGGKLVALTLDEATGGNLPLRYELDPLSELKRYDLIFDHESGILSGTPQQEAFTVNVALDIFDSGGDDAKPLVPDLEFQIVSREGEPAYYEIDLTGGAGSTATLHFPDQDGNEFYEESTEESIAGIDSTCQDGSAAGFGKIDCPYSADYIFGGAKHREGLGDIPGVMVVVGLKSSVSSGGNTVCAGVAICPAGVKMFTISFQNENNGKTLSVNARVLLPRPAFDPAFASSIFVKYIQGSPNPLRRPLPAADGGNGRLIYSIDFPADLMTVDFPAALTTGLAFHKATRRLLKNPPENAPVKTYPLTMTVTDSNGNGDSDAYLFTIEVQEDTDPKFAADATTVFTVDLDVAMTLTLPKATDGNRETRYSASTEDAPPGMRNFDPQTRELSGTPTEASNSSNLYFIFDYIATDPDEDYDENGIPHSADDDITIRMISVFVDDKPSFGSQIVAEQNYIVSSPIPTLTLPEARGGNLPLIYTLTNLAGVSLPGLTLNATTLSGTPEGEGTTILIYTVTDSDPSDSDSATLSVTINIAGDSRPMFASNTFGPLTLTQTWPIVPAITLPAASGGNIGIAYMIEDEDDLPGDLMFNSDTRELSGTPTVTVMFTIRIIAEDMDGNEIESDTDTLEVIITVAADIAPVLPGVDDQNYIENSQIVNLTLPEATGGNGGVTMYSLTPPPTGLTFNADPNSRVLSGTPRVTGVFDLDYMVIDSDPVNPDPALTSFRISIEADAVPSFDRGVPQQNYFQGEATMTLLPMARGGNGLPLTYRYSGLPEGITITLNSATRELTLSGTPTQPGSFVATIVAMDTDGNTDESDNGVLTFRIEVEADIEPTFAPSPDVDGETYTYRQGEPIRPLTLPRVIGGNEPLRYSFADPGLPIGLRFNFDTGIINGTPSVTGASDDETYNIRYFVEDRDDDLIQLEFTIIVQPPL